MRTLQKIGVVGTTAILLLGANIALAEEGQAQPTVRPVRAAVVERKEVRSAVKKDVQDVKVVAKNAVKDVKEEARIKVADIREKAKQKLADIKDKAKQQLATKLASQFENINKTSTDHFTAVLNQLDVVLTKVETRAVTASANGKNVASTTATITSARTAITTARTAVLAQATKVYIVDPITLTTTSSTTTDKGQGQLIKALRDGYNALHKQLVKDLATLRDGVMKDARKATADTVGTVAKATRVEENHTATSTDNN